MMMMMVDKILNKYSFLTKVTNLTNFFLTQNLKKYYFPFFRLGFIEKNQAQEDSSSGNFNLKRIHFLFFQKLSKENSGHFGHFGHWTNKNINQ
jgi:hypothetical protein